MKRRSVLGGFLVLVSAFLLVACNGQFSLEDEENVKTVYVGPELVDCVGVAPQQCLQVKVDPQAEYTMFYGAIEGFEFEAGFEYELRVREETVENPPADASSLRWTLVEVVSKTPAQQPPSDGAPAAGGEIVTMFVGPETVECVGVAPQQCLQVKMNPEDEYGFFYDTIAGFEFEPGYEYELRVQVTPVENPPADAASLQYTLVEIVSQTPVAGSAGPSQSLEGPIWLLVAYRDAAGAIVERLPDSRVTAVFQQGRLTGTAGCNNYFASYSEDGSALTISQAGSTMMMCQPEALMQQETAFLGALSSVASYEISGSELLLRDAAGEPVLQFTVEEPIPLTGTTWNLLAYNNGMEAIVSTLSGTELTAVFAEEGQLSGSAGCNNYTASYQLDGDALTIGPAATTRMACAEPDGIMEQEAQYLAALELVQMYRIDGPSLVLFGEGGARLASYVAAQDDGADQASGSTETPDPAATPSPEAASATAEPDSAPAAEPGVSPEVVAQLGNATFPLDYAQTGSITLENGEFRQPAAGDTALEINTQLTEHVASGTLSNGEQVTAVILTTTTGGTGTFYDLIVLSENEGQWQSLGSAYLGDRIQVQDLAITDGQVVVDMITQGPEDPFCCPTQQVVQTYDLQGGELVLTSSTVVGTVESTGAAQPDLQDTTWQWQETTAPDGVTMAADPAKYTLTFSTEEQVDVSADCNEGSGRYTVDGSQLTISITATTLALCPPESQSDLFIRSVNAAASYTITDGALLIELLDGAGTMRFAGQ